MKIHVHLRDVPQANYLRDEAEERLRRTLGSLTAAVRSVSIRIRDVNGPRGGEGMVGRMMLDTVDGRTLVLEDTRASAAGVLGGLALRARRAVARHLNLRRDRRRGRA